MTFYNRVNFLATAGGLADFTVSTNVVGYRTPSTAAIPDGTEVSYVAQSSNLLEWETGHGSYNAGVVSRTKVLESSNSDAKVNFSAAPNVWLDCLAQDLRSVLIVDTTYYVASTGSDATGDGSVGNPWATIQYAVNFVMYNVTGKGIAVRIEVGDAVYSEAIKLGPHQIFAPNSAFAAPILSFSSSSTPGNLALAPTAPVGLTEGIISVANSLWEIAGGFTLTTGASGRSGILVYDRGQLHMGSDNTGSEIAVVFSDATDLAFDVEDSSNLTVNGLLGSNIIFNSTIGTLFICDQNSCVNFYHPVNIHFDIDPGFAGWAPGQPGMVAMKYSGGSAIILRNTYTGATAAAPVPSVISFGNTLFDQSEYLPTSSHTVGEASWYNGYTGGPLRVGTAIDKQTLDGAPVTNQVSNNGFDWANASFAYSNVNNTEPGWAIARSRSNTPGAQSLVANGDGLGSFWFYGSDGVSFQESAAIRVLAEGTPAAGHVPARISFWTTPPGGTLTERVRIDSDGILSTTVAQLTPTTIAGLPSAPAAGMIAAVSDGDAGLAWGATVVNSGAGSHYYTVNYNGTNWTVMGK